MPVLVTVSLKSLMLFTTAKANWRTTWNEEAGPADWLLLSESLSIGFVQCSTLPYHVPNRSSFEAPSVPSSRLSSPNNVQHLFPNLNLMWTKYESPKWKLLNIPKCDRHIRTYIDYENRSLIQSLILTIEHKSTAYSTIFSTLNFIWQIHHVWESQMQNYT